MSIEDALESTFIHQYTEILHDEAKSFWIGLHRSYTGLKPTYIKSVPFRLASMSNQRQPKQPLWTVSSKGVYVFIYQVSGCGLITLWWTTLTGHHGHPVPSATVWRLNQTAACG